MVKQLRDRTDQPMGLCKQALDQTGGDMEKAIEWLRSQNKKMGVKREGNETAEGRIGVFFDNAAKKAGASSRCAARAPRRPRATSSSRWPTTWPSTSPTSKAADVPAMLAEPFGGKGTVQDRINDVVGVIREKMILHKFQRLEGGVYGGYVHHDGTVGVLLECKGAAAERRAAPRRVRAHRGAQPAVRDHRRRARRRDGQGEGAREGGHRRRPEERRQAREHPREDRRGQAADAGSPRSC